MQGFEGPYCERCSPGFFGDTCALCNCSQGGRCDGGMGGTGCICTKPFFGRFCDRRLDLLRSIAVNSDWSSMEGNYFEHWWPYASGYVARPNDSVVGGMLVGVAEVSNLHHGGGLGMKVCMPQLITKHTKVGADLVKSDHSPRCPGDWMECGIRCEPRAPSVVLSRCGRSLPLRTAHVWTIRTIRNRNPRLSAGRGSHRAISGHLRCSGALSVHTAYR